MSDSRPIHHQRATQLFLEAAGMDDAGRRRLLDGLERQDPDLWAEVVSLLAHDRPDTILAGSVSSARTRGLAVSRLGALMGTEGSGGSTRWLRSPWTRAAGGLGVAAALSLLGFWTHARVEGALAQIRADELQTVLAGEVRHLRTWVSQELLLVQRWARDPRVVDHLTALQNANATDPDAIWASPHRTALDSLFTAYEALRPGYAGIGAYDRDGVLFYATTPADLGRPLEVPFAQLAAPVWDGASLFLRPMPWGEIARGGDQSGTMYASVHTPLIGPDGEVIAGLAAGQRVSGPFTELLDATHLGRTGESYAFDDRGRLLSKSRFDEALRQKGLILEGLDTLSVPEWRRSSILSVEVRDPGGDLLAGFEPTVPRGSRPLTRLAAAAIARASGPTSAPEAGVELEPYRNYRGVEVIGAWRWLPGYRMGIATEIEASEAFAPLQYLRITFGLLFGIVVLFVGTSIVSGLAVLRLRRQMGKLRQMGQYTLLDEIGQGGMGKVFLAQHGMLRRPTAVKIIAPDQVTPAAVARFEREVQLVSTLTHPNTIEIFDYGRTSDGVLYYAMEYLDGITLNELVKRSGPVPPARVAHILHQICGSLAEAHEAGLVHRDIKPRNVMLCQRDVRHDVVKVLDFGLAQQVMDRSDEAFGRPRIEGTPLYMAPERLGAPRAADHRADLYSVGALAYFLVAGRPVIAPGDTAEVMERVLHQRPVPPSHNADAPIPAGLEALILACLEKDPGQRPQTAQEILESLAELDLSEDWTPADAAAWWARFGRRRGPGRALSLPRSPRRARAVTTRGTPSSGAERCASKPP